MVIQIPHFLQFLKGNELNEMWHMIPTTLNAYFRQFVKNIFISMCQISGISDRMLYFNHAWEPHVNKDSFRFYTEFLKENDQKSTWKSMHMSDNIVYSQICHKYIHIMAWKDQKENK